MITGISLIISLLINFQLITVDAPVPLTPGFTSSPGKIIPYENTKFSWSSISNADFYGFYIEEKVADDIYKELFNSEDLGLLVDTIYNLPSNIFKKGTEYRWRVRAQKESNWSDFSNYLYIRFEKPLNIPATPEPIFPGNKNKIVEQINTRTPKFKWKQSEDAQNYILYVSEKNVNENFKLIFNSSDNYNITTNSFELPAGILQNNKTYRWNIRAQNKLGLSDYSDRFYFSVKLEKNINFDTLKFFKTNDFSPGNTQPAVVAVEEQTPEFNWPKIPDAIEYGFYLYELQDNGNYELIFNSEINEEIKTNYFKLPQEIIKNDRFYKWKVRGFTESGWLNFSKEFHFYTQFPEKKNIEIKENKDKRFLEDLKPKIIEPGIPFEFAEQINSINPVFKWKKFNSAESYQIYISEKNISGDFTLIFNSKNYSKITDTTFTMPSNILENGKTYRWNIRAIKGSKISQYSEKLYFQINLETENKQEVVSIENPETLYPGQSNFSQQIFFTNPLFKWRKVKNASGYYLYISERDARGDYNLVYNSENRNLIIKDTVFNVPDAILKNNSTYRWNLVAIFENGRSDFSGRLYFTINAEQPDKPKLVNPGNLNEPGELIKTLNPEFTWDKVNNANGYGLYISKRDEQGIYNLIYSSERKGFIQDTFLVLEENLLENFGQYRWNMRAHNSFGWSKYTDRLYFRVNLKQEKEYLTTSKESPKIIAEGTQEIFVAFKYGGLVNTTITAYYNKDEIYLPVKEMFDKIQVNNHLDPQLKTITGKIFKNKEFTFNFNKNIISFDNELYKILDDEYIETTFDYYIKPEILTEVFGIEPKIDFSNLSVKLKSKKPLPVYEAYLRQQSYQYLSNYEVEKNTSVLFDRKWHAFNGVFIDYYFSHKVLKNFKPVTTGQLGIGGELFGGEAEYNLDFNIISNKFYRNNSDFRWRYIFDNNYISQFSVGNLTGEGLNSYLFKGIKISNAPITPRKLQTTYKITDFTQPNWTVELYINDRLVDYTKANDNGYYEFNIPMFYGTTPVQIRFYGKNGEYFVKNKIYNIPFNFLPPGEVDYNINYGNLENTNEKVFQSNISIGLTNWLSNTTGVDYLNSELFNKPVFYNSISTRISSGYLINITTAPDAYYRASANALFYNNTSIGLSYTRYKQNRLYNSAGVEDEIRGSGFFPFFIKNLPLYFQLSGRYQKINITKRYDASVTITSNFASFNPTLRYRFFNIQNPSSNFKSSYLNAGFFYSFSILPESLRFLRGNILAVNSDYNLESNKFENIFFSISSNITRIARLQFTLSNSFITNTSTSQIELIFDLPFTRTSTYATENSLTQSIQGSVGYDNAFSDFSFYSRQQIGRAAASFRLFVDDNNNNNYDFGEIIIKDGDISLGVSVTKFKDKNGIIRVRELIPYEVYSVNIIESSIKNPLLVPEYNNFTFRTEPNTFKIIDIPFYIAGEISGKVFKTIDDFKDPVSGIDVIIENVDGTFKKSIKTFADGSYYYFGLKPGSYIIYLNKEQLNFLNLQPDKKENFIEIENKEYGDIVREIDFGLTKKN